MPFQTAVTMPNTSAYGILLEVHPDMCPACHHGISPLFLVARSLSDAPFTRVDVAFQCTRASCRLVFVGRYRGHSASGNPFTLEEAVPLMFRETSFSDEIAAASPMFVSVYNQAMEAEAAGLDQLVGMGLRKALEFLIKDFAVGQAGTDAEKEQIKKKLLGQAIKDHIKDAAVKEAAKRATWLGNDETHYLRKWETKDITDLKKLVRLTVNAVENVLLTAHYAKEMPS